MKIPAVLIALFLTIASNIQAQNNQPIPTLWGTWIHVKTVCCGPRITKPVTWPLKEGVVGKLSFRQDSTMTMLYNGELFMDGEFHITSIYKDTPEERYDFTHPGLFGTVVMYKDTMVIGNCKGDGCDMYYVKEAINKKAVKRMESVKPLVNELK